MLSPYEFVNVVDFIFDASSGLLRYAYEYEKITF